QKFGPGHCHLPCHRSHRQHWRRFHNYSFEELVVLDERDVRVNSPQNGLLLMKTVHGLFGQYEISINPNDDYRIVCFLDDTIGASQDDNWIPYAESLEIRTALMTTFSIGTSSRLFWPT
ncbi:uncharacterized protein V1513DRAFT_258675, partial [Lipomyces chichibuensis]|uniref:uncharacterized protein n=1 Tax=Lipomyces chichibuensis TaxID=1546026 RepID=UPI0033431380